MNRFQIALDVLLPLLYTPSEVCSRVSLQARHVIQLPMILPARDADSRCVHPLLALYAPSDWNQPLSVCAPRDVCQGTRGGDRRGGRGRSERERAVHLGVVEDLERGWE